MTATGLEPRTTQFVNEHSTIWPNWPVWVFVCELSGSRFESNCSHLDINKVNKWSSFGWKNQIKTKKLVVNEKKKVSISGDKMVKHIQGWNITKEQENKQSLYQVVHWIKINLYEWLC